MSAADLFKDAFDVEFRLKGTFIMIGRLPYYVKAVTHNGIMPDHTVLMLSDTKDDVVSVTLGRLPLSSMVSCPSGYHEGMWYTRGPARHRYQGITYSCLWAVTPDGMVESGGVANCKKVLQELASQPRTRRPGKRPQGTLTRDVHICPNGMVLVRGRLRAEYLGENTVRPLTELSPISQQMIDNAKLRIKE